MDLTVIYKTLIAADTLRIRLAAPEGSALPSFKPGAHIELRFAGFRRSYSLTSSPRDDRHYEICVLRTHPSRGGSAYLHDRLGIGDRLIAAGPFNAFPLNLEANYTVLIAGGIGITPFFSMMEALDESSRPFELHYAAQRSDRFLPVLARFARTREYPDIGARPSMDLDAILEPLPTDADLYVCGPRGLIEAVRAGAGARGWPDARIHFESFGAGTRATDTPVTIHLALSRLSIQVEPGTSILDALLANGVWAPHECRRGECGSCMTEVLSGDPDHRDLCLTEAQRRHAMCTCVSWGRTPEIGLNL